MPANAGTTTTGFIPVWRQGAGGGAHHAGRPPALGLGHWTNGTNVAQIPRPPREALTKALVPSEAEAPPAEPLPAPHQVSSGVSNLPRGSVTTWGLTRDTTPKTARVQHLVTLALTPLPQGDFTSWAPPLVPLAAIRVQPHQVTLAEDLRRLQRFRLERHGGPAGFIEPPPEDTTRLYPHQAYLAQSRFPEGGYFSWHPPQDTFPRRFDPQIILAPSRTPQGDFTAWGPPPFVPPLVGRIAPFQIVLAPSRYPDGDFFSWGPPPTTPVVPPTHIPPLQYVPAAEDRRRHWRWIVIRTGGAAGIIPFDTATPPGSVSVIDTISANVSTEAVGAAVTAGNYSGGHVQPGHSSLQEADSEAYRGTDVEVEDVDP